MMRILCLALLCLVVSFPARAAERKVVLDIQEVTSEKGIKIWLVADDSLPVLALSFAFRTGTATDPADKQGLTQLLSNTLDEGAGDLDDEAFQGALRDHAISLSFNASRDAFSGQFRTLTRHRDRAVELMKLAVNAPRFDTAPVERMKQANLARIRSSMNDASWIAARILNDRIYENHPYALNSGGTLASLAALAPGDLREAHKRHVLRGNLVVALAGDVTPADAARIVDDIFGALPDRAADANLAEAKLPDHPKPAFFARTMPQTDMSMAWPGIDEQDPDFYAATVMDYIFGGGGFSSRLMNEVREARGLTYGIYSSSFNYDYADRFIVQAAMLPENVAPAIALVHSIAASMRDDDVSAKSLQDAKDYLTGSLPLRFSSTAGIAGALVSLQLNKRPITALDDYRAKITAVTQADIRRVAGRIFSRPPVVVLVGAKPEGIDVDPVTVLPNTEGTPAK